MTDVLTRLRTLEQQATPGPWRLGEPMFCCQIAEHGKSHPGAPACRYTFAGRWYESTPDDNGDRYWDHTITRDAALSVGDETRPQRVAGTWDYESGGIVRPTDAAFIVAMRNMLPGLLAVAEAAQQVVTTIQRDEFCNYCAARPGEGEGACVVCALRAALAQLGKEP